MSDHKFSIGHVIGLGITAVSMIAAIVQYGSGSTKLSVDPDKLGASVNIRTQLPVVDPMHLATFEAYEWSDSFPFFMEPLAGQNIRYITIERYSLSPGYDTVRSSLELGPESGDRNLLVTYVVDPVQKRLRDLKSRAFVTAKSERPLRSKSESVEFEESMHPGYPEIARRFTRDGKDFSTKGQWLMDGNGKPLQLVFDGKPARKFHYGEGVEACLETEEEQLAMTIFVTDSVISEAKLHSKALKIRQSTLLYAGFEQASSVPIVCYQGTKNRPKLRLDINSAGELQTVWKQEYDSLGRPSVFESTHPVGNAGSFNVIRFYYNGGGALQRVEADNSSQVEVREFRYGQNGWPERLLHYVRTEGDQIRILSRSFFKFRQQ